MNADLSFLLDADVKDVERDSAAAYLVLARGDRRASLLDAFRGEPARAMKLADRMLLAGASKLLPFQSPTIVANAVQLLALGGSAAKPRLLSLTKKGTPAAALSARLALAAVGETKEARAPKAAQTHLEKLGSPRADERALAVAHLARLAAPEALAPLRAALEDASISVRVEAARALGVLADAEPIDRWIARLAARPKSPPASSRGAAPSAVADAMAAYDGLVRSGDVRAVAPIVGLAGDGKYATWIAKLAETAPLDALAQRQPMGIAGLAERALADRHVLDQPFYMPHLEDPDCAAAAASILARWCRVGPPAKRARRAEIAAELSGEE